MSRISDRYIIHYKGLSLGAHHFDFEIDGILFQEYQSKDILNGNLIASVDMVKHSTMLELEITVEGQVEVTCDRCLEPFWIDVDFEGTLIVRIVSDELSTELDDEMWVITNNEHELNLAHYLYESVCLSIPLQHFHGVNGSNASDCDKAMLSMIAGEEKKIDANVEKLDIDPRWESLKNLKSSMEDDSIKYN